MLLMKFSDEAIFKALLVNTMRREFRRVLSKNFRI
jgi:hypothetical protein